MSDGIPTELLERLVLERMHDAAFATDLQNRVIFWTGSAERMFGYATAEAVGRPFGELLPFEMAASRTEADLIQTIESGRSWRGEGAVRLRDGTELWIESTASPLVVDGRVAGAVSVSRDMTAHRREVQARAAAEQAMRETEAQFRDAFEHASIGMALTAVDGRWLKVNPALVGMLGYTEAEFLGHRFQDFTHPEDVALSEGHVARVASGSVPSFRIQKRYVHKDGHVVPATLSVSLARSSSETPRYLVSQIVDRSAEVDLELDAQVRVALGQCLHDVPTGATLEQSAQTVCDHLATLPWVDFAAVQAFVERDDCLVLANRAPEGFATRAGDHLSPERSRYLQQRASQGAWGEYPGTHGDDGFPLAAEAGIVALAYVPIGNGDPALGVLAVGTRERQYARTLVEKMPGLVPFGTTASALLAERLHARRAEVELRRGLEEAIRAAAFRPVFQPIVSLRSGEVVGYEALTRFDSGRRPDLCFADAWSVGLGIELELAALELAIAEATALPAGAWLDLNVSPRLLSCPERLRSVLWRADRPLVLEITEHEPVADYRALRDAISGLGRDIHLAVDDAGAGVANFGHIVELRPDFVKLDIGLVRRVNANLGRQALVVAMSHFARTAGCRLVAEGVETRAEADTVAALGVEYAQGYLFGRPSPAADQRARSSPQRRAGRRGAQADGPSGSLCRWLRGRNRCGDPLVGRT